MANTLEEKNKAASNDFNTRVVECRISAKILAKSLLGGETWRDLMKLKAELVMEFFGNGQTLKPIYMERKSFIN